jgi:hypothetical protein
MPILGFPAIKPHLLAYGDGSDGDVTLAIDTVLTQDMFYNKLTVPVGINLTTAGFRVFVKVLLTLNGVIRRNGNNAVGAVEGAGLVAGTLGASSLGGTGSTGVGVAGGSPSNSNGGSGGAGGAGSGGAGGAAGVATAPAVGQGGPDIVRSLPLALTSVTVAAAVARTLGGAGGGGGGGDGVNSGGGGGGGGGAVLVSARAWTGTGSVEAKGGVGAAGVAGDSGGGGGGGGGSVVGFSEGAIPAAITFVVTGGAPGAGVGTGVIGVVGVAGKTFRLVAA